MTNSRFSTRRGVVLGLVGLGLAGQVSAGGGRDPEDKSKSGTTGASAASGKAKVSKDRLGVIPQDAYIRMSAHQMLLTEGNEQAKGKVPVVEGFSPFMTRHLRMMLEADPRSAHRLMRDMKGLKTPKARQARLDKEERTHRRRIAVYDEAIEQYEAEGTKEGRDKAKDDRRRRSTTRQYLRSMGTWQDVPMEGTY